MKKFSLALLIFVLMAGSFLAGRHFGRNSGRQSVTDTSTMPIFDSYFNALSITEAAIEAIDSGGLDDAKHLLRLNQDGNILGLDQLWDSEQIASRDGAEKLLTRIARHRAEYPWKYAGTLPASTDPQAEVKILAILNAASKKQLQ